MKKFKLVHVINLNSLHDEDEKGDIRRLKTYYELGDLQIFKCKLCGIYEVRYAKLPYDTVIPGEGRGYGMYDIVKFMYNSSPRGAHQFKINFDNVAYKVWGFPNSYKGWGSYPSEAFIRLAYPRWRSSEATLYAVRGYNTDGLRIIGTIDAGNSGTWDIITPDEYPTKEFDNINYDYAHPSCLKKEQGEQEEQEQTEEQVEEQAG